jgi:hypothetical protein
MFDIISLILYLKNKNALREDFTVHSKKELNRIVGLLRNATENEDKTKKGLF